MGLPKIIGRFRYPTFIEEDLFFAVWLRGLMDDTLLNDYISWVLIPLFPNILKTTYISCYRKLLSGQVSLKLDAGQGQIVADEGSMTKRDELDNIMALPMPQVYSKRWMASMGIQAHKSSLLELVVEELFMEPAIRRLGETIEGGKEQLQKALALQSMSSITKILYKCVWVDQRGLGRHFMVDRGYLPCEQLQEN